MDEPSKANPLSFKSTAVVPFFIILLLCFICIFLLLGFFIYKCFEDKKDEMTEQIPCIGANRSKDCSPANEEANSAGDQEKILMQIIDLNAPVRPGILVQRRNKEVLVTPLENTEDAEEEKEDRMKDRQEPERAEETNRKGGNVQETLRPSVSESQKRPLKGVTFSREVIVVDLGNEHPAPQKYTPKHKERKRSPERHKRKRNVTNE